MYAFNPYSFYIGKESVLKNEFPQKKNSSLKRHFLMSSSYVKHIHNTKWTCWFYKGQIWPKYTTIYVGIYYNTEKYMDFGIFKSVRVSIILPEKNKC